jgi:hypothetical protein
MGRPGGVHDQRHAGGVRGCRMRRDVRARTEVRRIAEHDAAGAGVRGERGLDGGGRHGTGQPGGGVQFGPDPHRPQPGQHDAEQQRAMQGTGDDDVLPGPAEGQNSGLIGVRRAAGRQPAPVHAPGGRRPLFSRHQQPAVLLHRVQARIQRHITAHHVTHQVRALLVTRDRERHRGARTDSSAEPQPATQQRRVTRQTKRIPGIMRLGHHQAHLAKKRPAAPATAIGYRRSCATSTHSSTACNPPPAGPQTTVGTPLACHSADSIQ